MTTQPEKLTTTRRKRRAPMRRIPTAEDQRERKPFIFGWGADLNRREREHFKERIALFGAIGLALALAIILGWGWYQDNIAGPAAARAEANKPVAQVGKYVIRLGYFKRYEQFEQNNLQNQQSNLQQQLASLQTDPKKNAAQIAQLQQQGSLLQQQMGQVSTISMTNLISDQVVLQRSHVIGLPVTKKAQNKAMTQLMQQVGGRVAFIKFINQSGLSYPEIQDLVTADYLKGQIQTALSKKVSHFGTKVRASHILVPAKKYSLALRLFNEVSHGTPIGPLAKKYSIDPGSAKKGGDLGWFAKGTMVAQFDKAAFSMKVGQVKLVKSQYGWHVIKLTGRERVKLSSTEYQQQQQGAYQTWLAKEQAVVKVQRFIAAQNLPVPATTPTTLTQPVAPPPVAPAVPPVQVKPSTKGKAPAAKPGAGKKP